MSLVYRGHAAKPSPTAKTVERVMQGQFLGQAFPIRIHQKGVTERARTKLQYCGILY